MENNLRGAQSYSEIMYGILSGIKESMAMKKFRETTDTLLSLGYTNEEIKEVLKGVLNKVNYN